MSCDILLQTQLHYETSLLIGWSLVYAYVICAKKYTLKDENVKKCIRVEVTVLIFVIWVGNCQFYGCNLCFMAPLVRRCKMKCLLPKWQFWVHLSPNFKPSCCRRYNVCQFKVSPQATCIVVTLALIPTSAQSTRVSVQIGCFGLSFS